MSYNSYSKELKDLQFLIQHDMADSPVSLAKKFSISERTVYRLLDQLKEDGLKFHYSRAEKRYLTDK